MITKQAMRYLFTLLFFTAVSSTHLLSFFSKDTTELYTSRDAKNGSEKITYDFLAKQLKIKPEKKTVKLVKNLVFKGLGGLITAGLAHAVFNKGMKYALNKSKNYMGLYLLEKTRGVIPGTLAAGTLFGLNYLMKDNSARERYQQFLDFLRTWPTVKQKVPVEVHSIFEHVYRDFTVNGGILSGGYRKVDAILRLLAFKVNEEFIRSQNKSPEKKDSVQDDTENALEKRDFSSNMGRDRLIRLFDAARNDDEKREAQYKYMLYHVGDPESAVGERGWYEIANFLKIAGISIGSLAALESYTIAKRDKEFLAAEEMNKRDDDSARPEPISFRREKIKYGALGVGGALASAGASYGMKRLIRSIYTRKFREKLENFVAHWEHHLPYMPPSFIKLLTPIKKEYDAMHSLRRISSEQLVTLRRSLTSMASSTPKTLSKFDFTKHQLEGEKKKRIPLRETVSKSLAYGLGGGFLLSLLLAGKYGWLSFEGKTHEERVSNINKMNAVLYAGMFGIGGVVFGKKMIQGKQYQNKMLTQYVSRWPHLKRLTAEQLHPVFDELYDLYKKKGKLDLGFFKKREYYNKIQKILREVHVTEEDANEEKDQLVDGDDLDDDTDDDQEGDELDIDAELEKAAQGAGKKPKEEVFDIEAELEKAAAAAAGKPVESSQESVSQDSSPEQSSKPAESKNTSQTQAQIDAERKALEAELLAMM